MSVMLAPLSLRLAKRYDIDRRMIGLLVVYGAAAGNFSPLNPLGAIVQQTVSRGGLEFSMAALFFGNLACNIVIAAVIYVLFGGLRLARAGDVVAADSLLQSSSAGRLRADQVCTLIALLGVAIAALGFNLSIGFLAFGAAALLQLVFPASSGQADRKIAWSVVLLVCGIHSDLRKNANLKRRFYLTPAKRAELLEAVKAAMKRVQEDGATAAAHAKEALERAG